MKEEKSTFTVRSYTKSELAHLYNPQLTLKNATPKYFAAGYSTTPNCMQN